MTYISNGKPSYFLIGVGGFFILALAIYDWQTVNDRISGLPDMAQGLAQVGGGLYVVGLGGLAVLVAAFLAHKVQSAGSSIGPSAPPTPPTPPTPPVG